MVDCDMLSAVRMLRRLYGRLYHVVGRMVPWEAGQ